MTREEIINEIKPILEELNYPDAVSYLTQNDVMWLNENIKALEQEPCEDTISRQAAIDEIKSHYRVDNDLLEVIAYKISKLPSVQPKLIECEDAISRQDALDALHMCLSTNSYDDDVTGDSYICYEEAEYEIEKLPPVQPKPIECEDAISRQATIDTLWTERKKLDSCMQKCLENNQMSLRVLIKAERNRIEEDIYIINNLPPVTPQPKTGHWISYWDEEARCYVYKCPECGNKQPFDTKYCWECGTRLVKPQESEET